MKVLAPTLGVSLAIIMLVAFLGQLLVIAPLEKEISGFQENAKRYQDDQKILDSRLKELKPLVTGNTTKPAVRLLQIGDENALLQATMSEASASDIIVSGLNLLKTVTVKGAEVDNVSAPAPAPAAAVAVTPGNLPQLDANGMPIGIQESDETQDRGVEFLPMQLTLKGTWRSMIRFMHEVKKKTPVFVLRKMNITMDGSGLAKGTLEMIFPYGRADSNETGGNNTNGK